MALIAGFRLHRGGILICADRQQLTGAGKHSVEKIDRFSLSSSSYVVAGTGSSPILANALPQIRQSLQEAEKKGKDLRAEHQSIIGAALRPLHEEMIWGRSDEIERGISLIVAASFGEHKGEITTALYGNYGDTLYPAHNLLTALTQDFSSSSAWPCPGRLLKANSRCSRAPASPIPVATACAGITSVSPAMVQAELDTGLEAHGAPLPAQRMKSGLTSPSN